MNRFDFYPGDYLRDTTDLNPAEDGIYLRLMVWYYSNERPIEDSRAMSIARATTAEEQKITQLVLSRFFERTEEVTDGITGGLNGEKIIVWRHQRIDKEITKWVLMRKRAQINGKKGGRPPGFKPRAKAKHNPEGNPDHNPEAKLPSPSPSPSPNPSPSPLQKKKPAKTRGGGGLSNEDMEIARKYLNIFNAVFDRRCKAVSITAKAIRKRIDQGGWEPWQILISPILQAANDCNVSKLRNFSPDMLLRDGNHTRTGADGRTYGGTDWLGRIYGVADTLTLDEKLSWIAALYGLVDDIKRTGASVQEGEQK